MQIIKKRLDLFMAVHHFYNMIRSLRTDEQVVLYNNVLEIGEEDLNATLAFLENEFKKESLDYPYTCPSFNLLAGLWGAKTIYTAAQLLLYREHKEADLSALFPDYTNSPDASEMISADLCLRFLPGI